MDLTGKTSLITGAGGGIGRALATRFAAAGANLMLTALHDHELAATAELARVARGSTDAVIALAGDLVDPATAEQLVDRAVSSFGRLDCAVNCAGFYPPDSPLVALDEALARQVMEIDFWSHFHCLRAQIPALLKAGGGSIVAISSGAGVLAHPGNAIYSAAKHAVVGLARTAAVDHSREGVRVNVICPGMTQTPPLQHWLEQPGMRDRATALHPIGRLGRPEEIADAALWLCSDRSGFVTGAVLNVDGGYTAV